jgi:hypothetical protein
MYKYLSIAENLQEMMVMLKSLPAYTLVFDKRNNLVEINEPALKFLKLSNTQEYNSRKDEVFPTRDYIKTIIRELKQGKTVRYARTLLKRVDDSEAVVELCACMINGRKDFFLFQLFEISPSVGRNLGSFTSYTEMSGNQEGNSSQLPESVNWVTNSKNILVEYEKNKEKESRLKRLTESSSKEFGRTKYRKLTKLETLVSKLASLDMPISEIATITNKTNLAIRIIIRRVAEKQRLNIQKGVNQDSIDNSYMPSLND